MDILKKIEDLEERLTCRETNSTGCSAEGGSPWKAVVVEVDERSTWLAVLKQNQELLDSAGITYFDEWPGASEDRPVLDYKDLPKNLLEDKAFVLEAVSLRPAVYTLLTGGLTVDEDITAEAVCRNPGLPRAVLDNYAVVFRKEIGR